MKTLKIKSISDVITNSSSEVYMIYDDETLEKVKSLIDVILEYTGVSERFDDLFIFRYTIEYDQIEYDYGDYLEHIDPEKYKIFQDAKYPEKIDMMHADYDICFKLAKEFDERNYENGSPAINGYEIVVSENISADKKELAQKIADKFSNLDNIFDSYVCYC